MRQVGVHVRGVVQDSMIAAFLIDSSRMNYGIDPLALIAAEFQEDSHR